MSRIYTEKVIRLDAVTEKILKKTKKLQVNSNTN